MLEIYEGIDVNGDAVSVHVQRGVGEKATIVLSVADCIDAENTHVYGPEKARRLATALLVAAELVKDSRDGAI